MSSIIIAIQIVILIGLFVGSVYLMLDGFTGYLGIGWGFVGLGIFTAVIAFLIHASSSDNLKPCAKYETGMQFNAATKTTMPYRYCAVEGEWIGK